VPKGKGAEMKVWLWTLALLLSLSTEAWTQSQNPVQITPSTGTTSGGQASGTISSTNTWQEVFAPTGQWSGVPGAQPRRGCTIQNNGTHNMYVEEGTSTANASTTSASVVAPGNPWYCEYGGIALGGQVNIYGTSGDPFYAAQY
jgi:hypothetical protein